MVEGDPDGEVVGGHRVVVQRQANKVLAWTNNQYCWKFLYADKPRRLAASLT